MSDAKRIAKEVRELIEYGCRDDELADYIQNWRETQPGAQMIRIIFNDGGVLETPIGNKRPEHPDIERIEPIFKGDRQ